jgi:predicted nucleic acid-binding protein
VAVFVDTNVLVYAADPGTGHKHARARERLEHLTRRRAGRLSYQVLQEYYVTVTRKLTRPMDPTDARRDVRDLLA